MDARTRSALARQGVAPHEMAMYDDIEGDRDEIDLADGEDERYADGEDSEEYDDSGDGEEYDDGDLEDEEEEPAPAPRRPTRQHYARAAAMHRAARGELDDEDTGEQYSEIDIGGPLRFAGDGYDDDGDYGVEEDEMSSPEGYDGQNRYVGRECSVDEYFDDATGRVRLPAFVAARLQYHTGSSTDDGSALAAGTRARAEMEAAIHEAIMGRARVQQQVLDLERQRVLANISGASSMVAGLRDQGALPVYQPVAAPGGPTSSQRYSEPRGDRGMTLAEEREAHNLRLLTGRYGPVVLREPGRPGRTHRAGGDGPDAA